MPYIRMKSRTKSENDKKKINPNLTARIQARYGLIRNINIRDSIRQEGVLSVIEYATLMDVVK